MSLKFESGLVVGIDASRNRSGGAVANLIGVLDIDSPLVYGISEVHVWAYKSLMEKLPEKEWLIKHTPPQLERSLFYQLWWQFRHLPGEAKDAGCNILYCTDAAAVCRFKPMVVMSQDMLSYEPGVMKHFGITKARLRLLAILYIQNRAMRFSNGVIFLTNYASKIIQHATGKLKQAVVIPHGVDREFKSQDVLNAWPETEERPIECLYVSNAAMYKHQWVVVQAISELRKRGHSINLTLVGGGSGSAQELLDNQIMKSDPDRNFVKTIGFVPHKSLPFLLSNSDMFVFASSCENLPVTLLEAMAVGLPIACSNRGPMPEVLADGGIYFDPENPHSIAQSIERIISDSPLRHVLIKRAKKLSNQYSWDKCASETWKFLKTIAEIK